MSKSNLADLIVVDVAVDEYQAELAQGLNEDEVLQAGRHTFRRGGFLARHGIEPNSVEHNSESQKRILLNLDLDVVDFFEERAGSGQNLQAQINHVLRKIMEIEPGLTQE